MVIKKMNKVVVIGGSGFIGSHVADCLSEIGYQVTIYDNIKSPWLRKDQKMVVGNILDFEELKIVTEGAEFVYNFAGITDLNEASDNPIKTIEDLKNC